MSTGKIKTKINKNDDFYNMNETIKRRLSERNVKLWGLPNLVIIDGGKGQLDAAISARDESGRSNIPFMGIAKREEQVALHNTKSNLLLNKLTLQQLGGFYTQSDDYTLINVPHNTNLIKLIQRIEMNLIVLLFPITVF